MILCSANAAPFSLVKMPSIIVAHFAILALLFTCVIAAPVVEDQTHELAVREPNTALSRNEADWQVSFQEVE